MENLSATPLGQEKGTDDLIMEERMDNEVNAPERPRGMGWLWATVGVIALAGAAIWVAKSGHRDENGDADSLMAACETLLDKLSA